MKAFGFVMTVLFVLAAAVQWNDPDPVIWIVAYLVPAALCLGAALGRMPPPILLAGFVVYVAVALWYVPPVLSMHSSAFTTIGMESQADEEAREGLGMWICMASLGLLAFRAYRPRR